MSCLKIYKIMKEEDSRSIIIERTFDAPRELVFKAWTDPERVGQWWGPDGFTTTTQEMEVKPGGVWRFVMHGPDGTDYPNKIVFREVEEPARLVYEQSGDAEGTPVQFVTTVTFAEQAGKTHITLYSLFPSTEARDWVVREHGAIEGGKQHLARLDAHVKEHKNFLQIIRTFDAPRERVFKAWTDPEQLKKWFYPKDFTQINNEWELKPGGTWRNCMTAPDGEEFTHGGEYRAIIEPERIVFTHAWDDDDGNPEHETLIVIIFEDLEDKTRMIFTQGAFVSEESRDSHEGGWNEVFDKLTQLLSVD